MKKEFEVKCKNCGKTFTVIEEEIKFPIKGDKYFCCRSCANTRHHSIETKNNISKGLLNSNRFYQLNQKRRSNNLERYEFNNILGEYIEKPKKYYCGSKELDEQNYNISRRQSPKWFRNLIPFGFDITSLYSERIINEFNKVKELLYNEYVNNGLSPRDIYNKYNCKEYFNNSETLLHIFKDWNFPIRGYSKAVINAILTGNLELGNINTQYKCGWHTTWNNKEVYLRSSYELDYAKKLDEQQIDYEVEHFHIKYWDSQKQEYRCAIPDFYIPSTNTIVEIKSNYTLDIQNMKNKIKAYKDLGYNFKLICDYKEMDLGV